MRTTQDRSDARSDAQHTNNSAIIESLSDYPVIDYHFVAPLLFHRDTVTRFGEMGSRQRVSFSRSREYEDGVAVFLPRSEPGYPLDELADAAAYREESRGVAEIAAHDEDVYCDYDVNSQNFQSFSGALEEWRDALRRAGEESGHPVIESQTDALVAASLQLAGESSSVDIYATRGLGHAGRARFDRDAAPKWAGGRHLEGVEGVAVFVPEDAYHRPLRRVLAAVSGADEEMGWRLVPDSP